ncbi:phosphatase PAP2 family protein [Flavipsychrobacter stenotrophus]|uniref:Phosphatase PAP2 family protein n=1 Tax=Flavipsychrobacter stenotrophus TaxID=2077091 RepID=A0A2S7SS55_9BACT|nr:phosphatase PAP2 family protein [Flavipsychrobacter stenotrophus]PQJ09752.1 phosphatase PAP2 family protein [Flavipsychrobacter stenotrophus]
MPNSLQDTILYWDHIAWYYVNIQWRTPLLDMVMPFLRNQWFWVPVYFFFAVFMPYKYGRKGAMWCLLFFISFIISDQVSAALLKPIFHRLRPCNNPALSDIIHIIVPCGSGYSFPSSHAANHFSISVFTGITLGRYYKWVWPVVILWAAVVCYAQVYVGVHYPLDVTVGACIGICAGTLTGKLFNRYFDLRSKPLEGQ